MFDLRDLRATIVPKSDQLNAEQLLGGPMTIRVSEVTVSASAEQPVTIHYDGDEGRPYKPCKTMRKVLILAWGQDGSAWAGKSMTLFNDPNVKFGGQAVGGIRISHLSDIERDIQVSLTATRGKKAQHIIRRLETGDATHMAAIRNAATMEELQAAFAAATRSTKDAGRRQAFIAAKDARKSALQVVPVFDAAAFISRIHACTDLATLQLLSDEAEELPAGEDRERVMAALVQRDGELAGQA